MFKPATWAISALAIAASVSSADIVTYEYTGTVSTNTYWSSIRGTDVRVSFTIDTDVAASSLTANRAEYTDAIIDGFFEFNGLRFDIADDPAFNSIIVRTDVYDQNFGTYSNRYNISVSSDGLARGGFEYPGKITLTLVDNDAPRDTVSDLSMFQPLDTVRTISNGGVDQLAVGLGVYAGVSSTVTSGDGGIRLVPTPGSAALLGLASTGLIARRRRA